MTATVKLHAISGSLRARSTNTEVLRAVARLAPPQIEVSLESELDTLPFFNPDLDEIGMIAPPEVRAFRSRIDRADGLLISSPEYAHGVPGVLKNALDWLVSGTEILNKPICLLNAAPNATHAVAALAETLRTMSTVLIPDTSLAIPLSGRGGLDAASIVADPALANVLRGAVNALVVAADRYRAERRALAG